MDDEQNDDEEPKSDPNETSDSWNRRSILSVIFGTIPFILFIIHQLLEKNKYDIILPYFCLFIFISIIICLYCGISGIKEIRVLHEKGMILCIFGIILSIWWVLIELWLLLYLMIFKNLPWGGLP